jgi:geranylgeranyl pyrophosphate synthase
MRVNELGEVLNFSDLPQYIGRVNKILLSSVATNVPFIQLPAARIISSGGKRLRAALVIAAASLNDSLPDHPTLNSAAAIELVHVGSIVHDDIIDRSEIRWGKKTINSNEGVNAGIVIGDYLLGLAVSMGASIGQEVALVVSASITDLCEGQMIEMSDQFNLARKIESYNQAIDGKTASLFAAAARIGGICGGYREQEVSALFNYGKYFGRSFQLIDDLLDILGDPVALGKPVGNDIKEGVYTLPLLVGLQGKSSKQIKALLNKHRFLDTDLRRLGQILTADGSIAQTITEIKKNNRLSSQALGELKQNRATKGLSRLPSAYLYWALTKTVG